MSAIGWLIWSNVMIVVFFGTVVSRFLPLMATATTNHNQLLGLRARVNAHIVQTAVITQNHATQINTALTGVTAVAPIVSAGNASFLATLSSTGIVSKVGGNSTSANGIPAPASYSNTYFTPASTNFNNLLSYVNTMASDLNALYDGLQTAGIVP